MVRYKLQKTVAAGPRLFNAEATELTVQIVPLLSGCPSPCAERRLRRKRVEVNFILRPGIL